MTLKSLVVFSILRFYPIPEPGFWVSFMGQNYRKANEVQASGFLAFTGLFQGIGKDLSGLLYFVFFGFFCFL